MGPTPTGVGWDTYAGPIHINLPIATIQGWLDTPSTNYGWVIVGPNEPTGDGLQLASRENATLTNRPKLVVKTVPKS